MKKYIGLIKMSIEGATGTSVRLYSKFSDSVSYLQKWSLLYPNEDFMVIENDQDMEAFFRDFEDLTPVTEKEIREAQKLWDEIHKF